MKTNTKTNRVVASGGFVHGNTAGAAQGSYFNGSWGRGKRRTWWCQAGPVDTCCVCFPLGAGVGLMAANDLLNGVVALFYLHTFYVSNLEALLAETQSQYLEQCAGTAAASPECKRLKEGLDQAEGEIDVYVHLPISIYTQGLLCIVAGVVGLWAVFLRNKRAVKAYMLSWPAKFVIGVWGALDMRRLEIVYDVERGSITSIAWLLNTFCLLYFFKVSWSFYKKGLAHEKSAHATTSSSSNTSYEYEQPMLGMSTTV